MNFLKKYWDISVGILWLGLIVIFLFYLNLYEVKVIKSDPEWLRGIGFFLGGVGVAPLALLLARGRTETLKRQTDNDRQKTVTEAFAKSVELLGNDRSTARQGGIYALGRIAEDNPEIYHIKVMDIIASYIRQESRDAFLEYVLGKEDKKKSDEVTKFLSDKNKVFQKLRFYNMNMDVEAAVAVIRERRKERDKKPEETRYRFDLSNAFISNADFSGTDLSKVNFSDNYMIGCVFTKTDLTDTTFAWADLTDSDFKEADLTGSDFKEADLTGSDFKGANLTGSDFKGANLTGSKLEQYQVNQMKEVDGDTVLPEGLTKNSLESN